MHYAAHTIDDNTIRDVVESASAHERSVYRRLLGLPVRGRAGDRVDRELARRGIRLPESEAPR